MKSFDKMKHDKQLGIFKPTGINNNDMSSISNLYSQQEEAVKVERGITEEINNQMKLR